MLNACHVLIVQVALQQRHAVEPADRGGAVMLGAVELAKLRSELDVVLLNCRVFGDMMTENTPGQVAQDDLQLMKVNHFWHFYGSMVNHFVYVLHFANFIWKSTQIVVGY